MHLSEFRTGDVKCHAGTRVTETLWLQHAQAPKQFTVLLQKRPDAKLRWRIFEFEHFFLLATVLVPPEKKVASGPSQSSFDSNILVEHSRGQGPLATQGSSAFEMKRSKRGDEHSSPRKDGHRYQPWLPRDVHAIALRAKRTGVCRRHAPASRDLFKMRHRRQLGFVLGSRQPSGAPSSHTSELRRALWKAVVSHVWSLPGAGAKGQGCAGGHRQPIVAPSKHASQGGRALPDAIVSES